MTHNKKYINPQELHLIICRCNSRGDVEEWASLEDWREVEQEIANQKDARKGPSLSSMLAKALAK